MKIISSVAQRVNFYLYILLIYFSCGSLHNSCTQVVECRPVAVVCYHHFEMTYSGVLLKIKVGIHCKQCGRGAEVERHTRED